MDVKEIKRLLDAVVAAGVAEFSVENGDFKMTVKRHGDAPAQVTSFVTSAPVGSTMPLVTSAHAGPVAANPAHAGAPVPHDVGAGSGGHGSGSGAPEAATHGVEVTAPIVGTFYSAPSPDAPQYVKVGDRVKVGTVLCIIEAMKLMNEIEAEVAGTVTDVLVRNEEPVEFGQPLFRIEPD